LFVVNAAVCRENLSKLFDEYFFLIKGMASSEMLAGGRLRPFVETMSAAAIMYFPAATARGEWPRLSVRLEALMSKYGFAGNAVEARVVLKLWSIAIYADFQARNAEVHARLHEAASTQTASAMLALSNGIEAKFVAQAATLSRALVLMEALVGKVDQLQGIVFGLQRQTAFCGPPDTAAASSTSSTASGVPAASLSTAASASAGVATTSAGSLGKTVAPVALSAASATAASAASVTDATATDAAASAASSLLSWLPYSVHAPVRPADHDMWKLVERCMIGQWPTFDTSKDQNNARMRIAKLMFEAVMTEEEALTTKKTGDGRNAAAAHDALYLAERRIAARFLVHYYNAGHDIDDPGKTFKMLRNIRDKVKGARFAFTSFETHFKKLKTVAPILTAKLNTSETTALMELTLANHGIRHKVAGSRPAQGAALYRCSICAGVAVACASAAVEAEGGADDEVEGGADDEVEGGADDEVEGGADDEVEGGDDDEVEGGADDEVEGGADDEVEGGADDEVEGGAAVEAERSADDEAAASTGLASFATSLWAAGTNALVKLVSSTGSGASSPLHSPRPLVEAMTLPPRLPPQRRPPPSQRGDLLHHSAAGSAAPLPQVGVEATSRSAVTSTAHAAATNASADAFSRMMAAPAAFGAGNSVGKRPRPRAERGHRGASRPPSTKRNRDKSPSQ